MIKTCSKHGEHSEWYFIKGNKARCSKCNAANIAKQRFKKNCNLVYEVSGFEVQRKYISDYKEATASGKHIRVNNYINGKIKKKLNADLPSIEWVGYKSQA